MEVYKIEHEKMTRIDEADVEYEKNLENRLIRTAAAEIGGVEVLYISQQGTTEHGKQYDLVGVDEDGNLIVVELKRGKAPRNVIAQALDYVSRLRHREYDDLNEYYKKFTRNRGYGEKSLREAHKTYFDLDEPLTEDEFNTDQRIVIIGTKFDDAVTNMADYLRSRGDMDVVLVQYKMYRGDADGQDIELLTTNAIRRPISNEPAATNKSLSKKQKRRKEFWEEFQTKHQEYGLPGGYANKSASYGVYVFTLGSRNRPVYIRPKVEYNAAYNAIRFYEGARKIVTDTHLQEKFETAVDEAASKLDVELPSQMSNKYDFNWDEDEGRNFDKVTITHEDSDHKAFQDTQKVEEVQKWLLDTTLVFKKALEQLEEDGYIEVE